MSFDTTKLLLNRNLFVKHLNLPYSPKDKKKQIDVKIAKELFKKKTPKLICTIFAIKKCSVSEP